MSKSKPNPRAASQEDLVTSIMRFCHVDDAYNRNTFSKLIEALPYYDARDVYYDIVSRVNAHEVSNRAAYFTSALQKLAKKTMITTYDDFDCYVFGAQKAHEFSPNVAHFGILKMLYEVSCEYKGSERLLALTTAIETLIYGEPISIITCDREGNDILLPKDRRLMERMYQIARRFAVEPLPFGHTIDDSNRQAMD